MSSGSRKLETRRPYAFHKITRLHITFAVVFLTLLMDPSNVCIDFIIDIVVVSIIIIIQQEEGTSIEKNVSIRSACKQTYKALS